MIFNDCVERVLSEFKGRPFYILALFASSVDGDSQNPVIFTENGQIRGQIKQYKGINVTQFIGIPYSAPPVGNLRFQKPTRHNDWTGIRDVTKYGPSCMQNLLGNDAWLLPNTNLSEDCLHLNVYVPRAISKLKPKAVMVWIHGGGFTAGQGMLIDGSYLAIESDVIVVTINYRLGIFGFLSTEDEAAPGNYGLWDQKFAIEWVKRNIASFGGDPDSITIFGESAGGYSVGLLSVSPKNNGLFQRAISESGAVYSPRALAKHAKTSAENMGKFFNCSSRSTSEMIACLRQIPAEKIQAVQNDILYKGDAEMAFESHLGPVIDGELVVQDPVEDLLDKNSDSYKMFTSIDLMAGTNNAEGGLMYFRLMGFQQKYNFSITRGIPKKVLCELVAPIVAHDYFNDDPNVAKKICEFYGNTGSKTGDLSRSIVNIYADLQFVVPTVRTLRLHSDVIPHVEKKSYHYIFTHEPSYPWIQDRPPWLQGANHAGELPFVFGLDAMYKPNAAKPAQERQLSRQMMVYWSNFAKTGNPNSPVKPGVKWPEYNTSSMIYMNLTIPSSTGSNLYTERIKLWTETIPDIISRTSAAGNIAVRHLPFVVFGYFLISFGA